MPNKPATPLRNIRVGDHLWKAAMAKAKAENRNLSEVIRDLLTEYVANKATGAD